MPMPDSLPPKLTLPGSAALTGLGRRSKRRFRFSRAHAGITVAALLIGGTLGWWELGLSRAPLASGDEARWAPAAPNGAEQRQLDAAFAALKSGRFAEARAQFGALVRSHPRWTALNGNLALTALYGHDIPLFKQLVGQGEAHGLIAPADARYLLGQWCLDSRQFESAGRYFGEAAGADPSRPEIYFYWGECLLQQGRPVEAVGKFRAAQLRNPYPMLDGVYETQLWLAEVESGLETNDGTAARIDEALAADHPSSAAWFAAAARAVEVGKYAEAAGDLAKARKTCEPGIFRMVLSDPFFFAEGWRPELAELYAEMFPPGARPIALPPATPGKNAHDDIEDPSKQPTPDVP
jgi:tetratricopeptide (TPR) repeat protein